MAGSTQIRYTWVPVNKDATPLYYSIAASVVGP
jgi:hypothetical protein